MRPSVSTPSQSSSNSFTSAARRSTSRDEGRGMRDEAGEDAATALAVSVASLSRRSPATESELLLFIPHPSALIPLLAHFKDWYFGELPARGRAREDVDRGALLVSTECARHERHVRRDAVGAELFGAYDARLPQFGPRPDDALREVRKLAGDDERVYVRLRLREYRRVEVRHRRLDLFVNGGGGGPPGPPPSSRGPRPESPGVPRPRLRGRRRSGRA